MTPVFWIYFVIVTITCAVIFYKIQKNDKKYFRYFGYSAIVVIIAYFLLQLYYKPNSLKTNKIIETYKNLDTSKIFSVELTSYNETEFYYNKALPTENKAIIYKLLQNMKYSKKFRVLERPKIRKKYKCKINFKDGTYIIMPINYSKIYGLYFEVYAPGDLFDMHIADMKNDSLASFIKTMYYPEKIDLEIDTCCK